MKECVVCKESKPENSFSKCGVKALYRRNTCCSCVKESLKKKRKWLRGDRTAQSARYRKKYYNKVRAHRQLNDAVLQGRIGRPMMCEECGENTFLHAHHFDYSKPLKVKWVCWECHNNLHKV